MKRLFFIIFTVSCIILPVFADPEFQEDSFTFSASINPVWSYNQFDYINTTVPNLGPKDEAEYFLDSLSSTGIFAEFLAAYQFDVYYVGITGFGMTDLDASGLYDIQVSQYMGSNFFTESDKPYNFRSESYGAGIEFGSRYLLLGGYNGPAAISGPIFHNGVSFGLAFRQWHSNLPELNGFKPGYFVNMRMQFLLLDNLGLSIVYNTIFDNDLNLNGMLGAGVFVGF